MHHYDKHPPGIVVEDKDFDLEEVLAKMNAGDFEEIDLGNPHSD